MLSFASLPVLLSGPVLGMVAAYANAAPLTDTPAPNPIVMPYAEVIACAGATQAMSELEGGESERGRRLYDAALYWSLTAIQLGQTLGRPDIRTETDMTNARIRSVRELNRREPRALEHLDICIKSAPKLG